MDRAAYHNKAIENDRVSSLLGLLPKHGVHSVLDAGARDGYISIRLAERFERIVALDLVLPSIEHPRVECLQGDVTALEFPSDAFDAVLCAELLEHLPSPALETACAELARVSRRFLLIGVPYRQDTRVGRTTCRSCGNMNPPWGHVNSFDEKRLIALFNGLSLRTHTFVGTTDSTTNTLSAYLMDLAGNPHGTYEQDEPCIHCGAKLVSPESSSVIEYTFARASFWLRKLQHPFVRPHANWIHILFEKQPAA